MAGHFQNDVMDEFLNRLLGGVEGGPIALRVGLSKLPANRHGVIREPVCDSYRRAELPADGSAFGPSIGGRKSNIEPIVFPAPARDWGTILSAFVIDAFDRVIVSIDFDAAKFVFMSKHPATIKPGTLHVGIL